MIICGIDPGITGAVAVIDTDTCTIAIIDMPTEPSIKKRKITASHELADMLQAAGVEQLFLEEVGTMPGEGAVGAFSFGRGVGRIEGATDALKIARWSIRPAEWKGRLNVKAEKDLAVTRAKQLFPTASGLFFGPRGGLIHGRAEAALIAFYGCLKLNVTPKKPLTLIEFPR